MGLKYWRNSERLATERRYRIKRLAYKSTRTDTASPRAFLEKYTLEYRIALEATYSTEQVSNGVNLSLVAIGLFGYCGFPAMQRLKKKLDCLVFQP